MNITRGLETARSALSARRAELETIAQNVANARTEGYRRRRVELVQVTGSSGGVVAGTGAGVATVRIIRTGDRILEAQIDVETGGLAREQAKASTLVGVETVLSGGDGRGLSTQLTKLFDSFGEVATDPGAPVPRTQAVTSAQTLCDSISQMGEQLQEELVRNDAGVVSDVRRVNQITREVAGINVAVGQAGGEGKLPDLEDRRGVLLTELSKLCGATSVPSGSGGVSVVLGGHHLVQGELTEELKLVADPDFPGSHQVELHGDSPPRGLDGEIAGLIEARSSGIKANLDDLDTYTKTLADTINAVHAAGYGQDGVTGRNLFTYDATNPSATLALNTDIAADRSLFAAASAPGESGNGETALALEELRSTSLPGETYTIMDWHNDFLGRVGTAVQDAAARQEARSNVLLGLETRLDDMSGVSLDEEAAALATCQEEYLAAQKVLEVILDILDRTLEM